MMESIGIIFFTVSGTLPAAFGVYWSIKLVKSHLAELNGRDPNLEL